MKCKREDCDFESDYSEEFDSEGYCRVCSEIKSDLQREAAN